jgi:hypothetical protein
VHANCVGHLKTVSLFKILWRNFIKPRNVFFSVQEPTWHRWFFKQFQILFMANYCSEHSPSNFDDGPRLLLSSVIDDNYYYYRQHYYNFLPPQIGLKICSTVVWIGPWIRLVNHINDCVPVPYIELSRWETANRSFQNTNTYEKKFTFSYRPPVVCTSDE